MTENDGHSFKDYSSEVQLVKNPVIRWLYLAGGSISIVIGIIGIIIPLLPTTPFLLLAGYLYSKSSVRYYNWLMNHKRLGPFIRNYHQGKGIPLKVKISAISLLWFTILTSAYFFVEYFWLRILLIMIAVGVSFHLHSLPTLSTSPFPTNDDER